MKIKEGFVIREVAGSFIAVATGELSKEFNSMITVNETGKYMFECLQNDITTDELVSKLLSAYDVSEEQAKHDAIIFVAKLKEAKVLE